MSKRTYKVTNSGDTESVHLVKASTQAQAIGFVVRNTFKAEVASQDDLIALLGNGVKVEDAGDLS